MSAPSPSRCTAFLGARRVAFGACDEVARALGALDLSAGGLLVFDDASGALVDYPFPAPAPDARAAAAPQVGRPRLGVVAREVTLLPRHWDWLARCPVAPPLRCAGWSMKRAACTPAATRGARPPNAPTAS